MPKKIYLIFLLLIINFLICILAGIILKEKPFSQKDRIIMILRYDDFKLYDDKNSYKRTFEYEFLSYLIQNNVKIAIGVIPFQHKDKELFFNNYSQSRIELLKTGLKKGSFELCLHGYSHTNYSRKSVPSEFANMPLIIQREWIDKGKKKIMHLTGAIPKVFIPPFNSWDENTLIALKESDFFVISAEGNKVLINNDFIYFPYTVTPKDLKYLLEIGGLIRNKLVILNIHPHDLIEDKKWLGFREMKNLIKKLMDPNTRVELLTFNEAISNEFIYSHSDLNKMSKIFNCLGFWRNLPITNRIIKTNSLSAYRPYYKPEILYISKIVLGANFFIIGFMFTKVIKKNNKIDFIFFIFIILLKIMLLYKAFEYFIHGEIISGKRFSIILLLTGIFVGFLIKKEKYKA